MKIPVDATGHLEVYGRSRGAYEAKKPTGSLLKNGQDMFVERSSVAQKGDDTNKKRVRRERKREREREAEGDDTSQEVTHLSFVSIYSFSSSTL